ncbi:hypothetical protein FOA43_002148 [Brettanomyces nanus]|uniref:Ribosome-assembly protein 3 C-terminal domain-containing protein n=1 Tax=Eeniella nana TaxID=13502 RepID=A0A875S421_EENNA|nr:uncharacterized protein FOA43_002148 [Brettanomyces nanus]QPG74812.1 hypothetical protein FOA43_002148 [Brettanomyces nanus]
MDSSSSESEEERREGGEGAEEAAEEVAEEVAEEIKNKDITIEGLNLPDRTSINATKDQINRLEDKFQTMEQMKLDLSGTNNSNKLQQLNESINETREALLNEYLGKMLGTYSDDLDELRSKADFHGEMSLKLIAKLLKESGNVFDDSTLSQLKQ